MAILNVDIDSFRYGSHEILNDISFEVPKGQHLAIMGESGSGKSTLLKILYGLLHVEKGAYFGETNRFWGQTLIWFLESNT